MALIKLGGGIAQMSGSIGGTTFARNRYGAYARNRTVPTNPSSAAQNKIRGCAANLKAAWINDLTQSERNAWADYAANVSMVNRLGETINLSGYNQFCRTNAALLYQDKAIIEVAPSEFSVGEQDPTITVAGTASDQKISVAFDNALGWANEVGGYLLLQMGKPQNPTVNFFKGPWKTIGTVDGAAVAATSPASLDSAYLITAGQKLFLQARIMRADGRLSAPFRCEGTCTAGT
jgi:hypothetical protein